MDVQAFGRVVSRAARKRRPARERYVFFPLIRSLPGSHPTHGNKCWIAGHSGAVCRQVAYSGSSTTVRQTGVPFPTPIRGTRMKKAVYGSALLALMVASASQAQTDPDWHDRDLVVTASNTASDRRAT